MILLRDGFNISPRVAALAWGEAEVRYSYTRITK